MGKTQKQIANENGIKQVTVSKWLRHYFSRDELKKHWKYGGERPQSRGENHWTKKNPNHPISIRLMEGLRKGVKQSNEEIQKRASKIRGKKRSEEIKMKLSLLMMGEKNPQTKMRGEKSPFWKSNKTDEERLLERKYFDYHEWRRQVYKRDNYTCQKCYAKCGNGHKVVLNAHHIENYAEEKEKRLLVENGITLCKSCHKRFHTLYKRTNNNRGELHEYLQNKN